MLEPDDALSNELRSTKCEICRKIEALDDGQLKEYRQVSLGRLTDVVTSSCEFHLKLMGLESESGSEKDSQSEQGEQKRFSEVTVCAGRNRLRFTHWNIVSDQRKSGHDLWGSPLRYSDENGRNIGLPLDPSWIKPELLREWISSCDLHHGMWCRTRLLESDSLSHRPSLLIDARKNCLVDWNEQEYCALSYVWGDATSFLTTTSNVDQLKLPGALSEHSVRCALTETTRNAIELVRMLKSPFLWVDGLCVVQDDDSFRQEEIAKMSFIFANASVTIIAGAGANANYGLRGLQGIGKPRALPDRHIFTMPGGRRYFRPLFNEFGQLSKVGDRYSRRAWTFQEHVLSHRRIIFENQSVRWECEGAEWYEDIDHKMETRRTSNLDKQICQFRAILCGESSYYMREFVSEFNARELTYPQDVLLACAGILSVLASSGTGFVSGMPARGFDIAMLWQPQGCIDRRTASAHESTGKVASIGCLPSWSWAGWRCAIESGCWAVSSESTMDKEFGYSTTGSYTVRLVCTTTWQCSDYLRAERSPITELDHSPQYIRYVFCRTRRSMHTFTVGMRLRNYIDTCSRSYRRHPFHYEIIDAARKRVGILNIPPSSEQGEYQFCRADHVETEPSLMGTTLDLVEISASEVQLNRALGVGKDGGAPADWMWLLNAIAGPDGGQKIYNVLWVTWTGEYAERRALVWIDGRVWDAAQLSEIDLALG